MKLNHNSISAKLYRWFYNEAAMPNNLCPYFWKLVLMYVTILPYVLISLPAQLITKFKAKDIGETFAYTFAFYFVLFCLFTLSLLPINLFIDFSSHFLESFLSGSIILWAFILLFLIGYGIKLLIRMVKNWRRPKKMYDEYGYVYYGLDENGHKIYHPKPKPNILVEFIKAKYNKYCPKIDWDNIK